MRDSDYGKFCDMLDGLNQICDYQKEITTRKEKTYFHALKKFSIEDLAAGFEHLIENHKGSLPPPVVIADATRYMKSTGSKIVLSDYAKDFIKVAYEQGLHDAKGRYIKLCVMWKEICKTDINDKAISETLAFTRDCDAVEFSYFCGKAYMLRSWPSDEFSAKFKGSLIPCPENVLKRLVACHVYMDNRSKSRRAFTFEACQREAEREYAERCRK
jgi:hypothetical protein